MACEGDDSHFGVRFGEWQVWSRSGKSSATIRDLFRTKPLYSILGSVPIANIEYNPSRRSNAPTAPGVVQASAALSQSSWHSGPALYRFSSFGARNASP